MLYWPAPSRGGLGKGCSTKPLHSLKKVLTIPYSKIFSSSMYQHKNGDFVRLGDTTVPSGDSLLSVQLSGSASRLIVGTACMTVYIWAVGCPIPLKTIPMDAEVASVALDDREEILAVMTSNGIVTLYNLDEDRVYFSKNLLQLLFEAGYRSSHESWQPVVAFHPLLPVLTIVLDDAVALFDLRAFACIDVIGIPGSNSGVQKTFCSFSPDGRLLLIARSEVIQVMDVTSGRFSSLPIRSTSPIRAAAFHPSDECVAIVSMKGSVEIWQLGEALPKQTCVLMCSNPPSNLDPTATLSWTSDGKCLLMVSNTSIKGLTWSQPSLCLLFDSPTIVPSGTSISSVSATTSNHAVLIFSATNNSSFLTYVSDLHSPTLGLYSSRSQRRTKSLDKQFDNIKDSMPLALHDSLDLFHSPRAQSYSPYIEDHALAKRSPPVADTADHPKNIREKPTDLHSHDSAVLPLQSMIRDSQDARAGLITRLSALRAARALFVNGSRQCELASLLASVLRQPPSVRAQLTTDLIAAGILDTTWVRSEAEVSSFLDALLPCLASVVDNHVVLAMEMAQELWSHFGSSCTNNFVEIRHQLDLISSRSDQIGATAKSLNQFLASGH